MDNGHSAYNDLRNDRGVIEYAKESLFPFWEEAQGLFVEHWKEIAQSKNVIKLEPDTDKFKRLEEFGALEVYTARVNGVLVGYGVFIISNHLHYKSSLTAESDLLYLHPHYRNGWAGYRLIKFCHDSLHKGKNVQRVMWRMKPHRDFSAIIKRLGGKLHEYVYTTVRE